MTFFYHAYGTLTSTQSPASYHNKHICIAIWLLLNVLLLKLKGAGINTNMYMEAFHNTLKYVYMQGPVNRCDKCLHLLLQLARDKAFNHLVKWDKGRTINRLTFIHAWHKASLEPWSELVTSYRLHKTFVRTSQKSDCYSDVSVAYSYLHQAMMTKKKHSCI